MHCEGAHCTVNLHNALSRCTIIHSERAQCTQLASQLHTTTSYFVYVAPHHRKGAEVVGAATSLQAGLRRNRGSIPGSSERLFPSPKCSNRLWNPPSVLFSGYRGFRGPGWRNRYSKSLRDGWSRRRIPLGGRFSAPFQTGPGASPASYTMCTRVCPVVKIPGLGFNHPAPPSAVVK